jgi:hypothetical protein
MRRLNRGHLRFARAGMYNAAMDEVQFWTRKLREAEAELDEAKTRTALDAAAAKLQRAKAELKRLEAEQAEKPKRRRSPCFALGGRFLITEGGAAAAAL